MGARWEVEAWLVTNGLTSDSYKWVQRYYGNSLRRAIWTMYETRRRTQCGAVRLTWRPC